MIEHSSSSKQSLFCKRKDCNKFAMPGNGQYPYCSKSCRNNDDYQFKYKDMITALNAIRAEIRKQNKLLKELHRKWGSNPWTLGQLQIEGFIDGGYCKMVKHHSGKIARIFLDYGLLYDPKTKMFQIHPENELRID
jgi:hypothetical protein